MTATIDMRPDQNSSWRRHAASWLFVTGLTVACSQASAQAVGQASDPAWASIETKARAEGRVVLYASPVAPLLDRLRADFEKANPGIRLEYSRIWVASGVIAKIDAERNSGVDGADVIIATEIAVKPWYEQHAKDGSLIAPIGPDAKTWPAQAMLRGATPVLATEPMVFAYNSELVKTPMTGYRDLLRPELKGKLATTEIGSPTLAIWYNWLEETQGADFMRGFAAQKPRMDTGGAPASQALAAGEFAAIAFATVTTIRPLMDMGAPVKMVVPSPSFGVGYTGAILGWSKRPNAAQVFMNYLMSERGQTTWNGRGESASPRKGIPGSLDPESIKIDFPPMSSEAIDRLKTRWSGMLNAQ